MLTSNHSMNRNELVLASFILGVAILLTGVVATFGFYKVKSLSNTISVTGSAERSITSDVVKWTLQITHSTGLSDLPAGNADVQKDLKGLREFFKSASIKDDWVTVAPINVTTMYDYNRGGAPSGYTLTQTVVVESGDVETVKKASENAGELINKGFLVSTTTVEYFYSKLADLKQDILADAMKDAKMRAEKMVASGGGKIGSLREASMGVLQVTAKNSVEISDYGSYDTSAVEKKVTGVVRASFGID